jgi:hypothetical protein
MEHTIINYAIYSNQQIESHIQSTEAKLNDFAKIEGKHQAQKENDLTLMQVATCVYSPVQAEVQGTIEVIRQTLLIAPRIIEARELEQSSKIKCEQLGNEIADEKLELAGIQREQEKVQAKPLKKYQKWVMIAGIFVGIADGFLAFNSFHTVYPFLPALVLSLAVAAVIAISHPFLSHWVNKAKTPLHNKTRVAGILVAGFFFFYWISDLRVSALQGQVNIDVEGGAQAALPGISAFSMCGISFLLFSMLFFLSLFFRETKEEQENSRIHDSLCKRIKEIEKSIETKRQEIVDNLKLVKDTKNQVRIEYDYAQKSIKRAKHIGILTIQKFKQAYGRFNSNIPIFFLETPELTYDESLEFFEPQTKES